MVGDEASPGIIALSLKDIFRKISMEKDLQHQMRIGYIEIYNDKIYDLFDNRKSGLNIFESHGSVIINQREFTVESEEEVFKYFNNGNKCRRIVKTSKNERSSRSHTIFRITVESTASGSDDARVSNLFLVDLAGSEKPDSTKSTFNEGLYINKSLLALGKIIREISKKNVNLKHVNFRECKLTRILSPALGGNSWTAIICTISPFALEETYQTICFAENAKKAKTYPVFNQTPLPQMPIVKRVQFETPKTMLGVKGMRRRRGSMASMTSGSESDVRCPKKKLKPNEVRKSMTTTMVQQKVYQSMQCEVRSSSERLQQHVQVEERTQAVITQQKAEITKSQGTLGALQSQLSSYESRENSYQTVIRRHTADITVLETQLSATVKSLFKTENRYKDIVRTKSDEIEQLKKKLKEAEDKSVFLEESIAIYEKSVFDKEIINRALDSRVQTLEREKTECMKNFERRFKEFRLTLSRKDEIIATLEKRIADESQRVKEQKVIDMKSYFRLDKHYGERLGEMRTKFEELTNLIQKKFNEKLAEKETSFTTQLSAKEDVISKLTEEVEKQTELIARSSAGSSFPQGSFDSDLGRLRASINASLTDFRAQNINCDLAEKLSQIFSEVHTLIERLQNHSSTASPAVSLYSSIESFTPVIVEHSTQLLRLPEPSFELSFAQPTAPVQDEPAKQLTMPSAEIIVQKPSIKGMICPYCNRNFARKTSYQRHLRLKHLSNEQSYECEQCGATFHSRIGLESHSRQAHRATKKKL